MVTGTEKDSYYRWIIGFPDLYTPGIQNLLSIYILLALSDLNFLCPATGLYILYSLLKQFQKF
jgi:hypothetical protein